MILNKNSIKLLSGSLVLILFALGCSGTTARYKADEHGPQHSGNMEMALANIDKAMSDMKAMKMNAMKVHKAALQNGKELFNDSGLGKNGLTCNSCHPSGSTTGGEAEIAKKMGHGPYKIPIANLVGASARYPKFKVPNNAVITLATMNNNCIRMFLDGKRLPLDSPESFNLAAYVSSLSNGDVVQVGGNMGN